MDHAPVFQLENICDKEKYWVGSDIIARVTCQLQDLSYCQITIALLMKACKLSDNQKCGDKVGTWKKPKTPTKLSRKCLESESKKTKTPVSESGIGGKKVERRSRSRESETKKTGKSKLESCRSLKIKTPESESGFGVGKTVAQEWEPGIGVEKG